MYSLCFSMPFVQTRIVYIEKQKRRSKEQKKNSIEKREQSERVNNKELNLRSKRQERLTEGLTEWLRLQTKTLLLYISALRLRPVTTKKKIKGKEKTKTCIYNSCSCSSSC